MCNLNLKMKDILYLYVYKITKNITVAKYTHVQLKELLGTSSKSYLTLKNLAQYKYLLFK